jgi:predicted RecB family nuclease
METPVTASMLYDFVQCPHRLTMDLFGDSRKRDKVNPFVELLWQKGTAHEKDVISDCGTPFLDLSIYAGDEKERLTTEAINDSVELIYGGRIQSENLLGDPDLLRKEANGYVAGDIKSGAGVEGDNDGGKLKKHYAVQVALYTDILERKGVSSRRAPFIWDIHHQEVVYDLDEMQGQRNPMSMWAVYQGALPTAADIVSRQETTEAAYSGTCKMCHWYTECQDQLAEADDLTLLPELGRAKRDALVNEITTVADLAITNVDHFVRGKKTIFQGIGAGTLEKFHERAKLVKTKNARPYLTEPLSLPRADVELFFDIETDPMRDICYLHGFVERHEGRGSTERYVAFFTDDTSEAEEERAFSEAWLYIKKNQPCVVYYYSKYERTIWRKLQAKYPGVCSEYDVEDLFDPARSVDLYFDVVKKATEWPTKDYSIKTLAVFLGFKWRDDHPSGAASIQWFDEWVTTGDPKIKQRIFDYNEDDCRATRVLLDGIRSMS